MSFEPQQPGLCSVAALRYALTLHGFGRGGGARPIDDDTLREHFRGVDEREIARVARRFGLAARHHNYRALDPRRFVADLQAATARRHACILTFHGDGGNHVHWVTVAGFSGSRAILLDPSRSRSESLELVDPERRRGVGLIPVARLRELITPVRAVEPGDDHHYFLEVWPSARARARFLPGLLDRPLLERMRVDPSLRRHCDEHLDDLRALLGNPFLVQGEPAAALLARHRRRLRDSGGTVAWRSLCALVRAYPFVVRPGTERNALEGIGELLSSRWRKSPRLRAVPGARAPAPARGAASATGW